MLILIDQKMPAEAKKTLASFGDLLELKTEGITYQAISGHPDIFICQSADKLIVAPNLPEEYLTKLKNNFSNLITGEFPVGKEYPDTARYNAVATKNHLIHNFRHTDFMITRTLENLHPIQVDQGYCRCNLLPLKDDHFITSDEGIYKVLSRNQLDVLIVSPEGIYLEGFPHGFFGGCCGIWEDKVFVNGSLSLFPVGEKVSNWLNKLGYEIIELYDGPLEDCGSIIFVIK
jgi:hypothetical protein